MTIGSGATRCGAIRSSALRSRHEARSRATSSVLEVADPAVNDLEALGRGAAAEIAALDQHGAQAAQRRIPERGRPESAAADDGEVVLAFREKARIACHHPHARQSSAAGCPAAPVRDPMFRKM